jgi:hypothetical protein
VLEAVARSRPPLRTIVLGLDGGRWCGAKPPETYHPRAVFPESLYDADRLNDFLVLLNMEMLNTSFEQLAVDLKLEAPQTAADGYRNELDEANWKPFKPGKHACKSLARRRFRQPTGAPRLQSGHLGIPFRRFGSLRRQSPLFPPGPSSSS